MNGTPASFAFAKEQGLVVTPASGVVQGKTFIVRVDYSGQPLVVTDPDQSIEGWVPTDDGAFCSEYERNKSAHQWFEQPSRTSPIRRCSSTARCTTAAA